MKDPGRKGGVAISTRVGKREQVHCVGCRVRSLDVTPAWHHGWGHPHRSSARAACLRHARLTESMISLVNISSRRVPAPQMKG